jgi:hypothetical protein
MIPRGGWIIIIPAFLWITPGGPAFAAKTTLTCGSTTYEVSTGTNDGECTKVEGSAAGCSGGGNATMASCGSGCSQTKSGSATCTVKSASTPSPPKVKPTTPRAGVSPQRPADR